MRIDGKGPDEQLKLYLDKNVKGPGRADEAKVRFVGQAANAPAPADSIALSSRAREAAMAAEVAKAAPDLRAERVADLKNAITYGRYQVNSEKVAEKIIVEALISS